MPRHAPGDPLPQVPLTGLPRWVVGRNLLAGTLAWYRYTRTRVIIQALSRISWALDPPWSRPHDVSETHVHAWS